MLSSIWHRLVALFRRRRLERDLEDEVAFHLAMREADLRADGVPDRTAREMARRRFGNVTHLKEQTRDMWLFPSFESIAQDVRFALRTLRKSPGFTIVAVLALAIGIGGNTAIFSLVDAVRARALPYQEPERLVGLFGNVQRTTVERRGTSYPDYADWRAQATSFVDMAAFDSLTATLFTKEEPERLTGERVSPGYFSIIGISPARGRTFRSDEDAVGNAADVVILSDGLWKRRFGSDPNIIGHTITLNTRACTVVGIMPPGFKGLTDSAEFWAPFAFQMSADALAQRGNRGFAPVARLKDGVSLASAQAEMDTIARRLETAYPQSNEKRGVEVSPLAVELVGALRPALLMLMAAVAFVLLIACANVANLVLTRSEARRREIAVRTALGAGRGRLLRQLITESCVLTLIGAAAGILLARVAVDTLLASSPVTFPSFVVPGLDLRVAAFTIVVSLACGILVGLAPGLQSRAVDLSNALKESAKGSGGRRSQQVRGALVIAEVSMAVVLLIGAGLMIRSVRNLVGLDPGFNPSSVLTLRVNIPRAAAPAAPAPAAPSGQGGTPALPPTPPPLVVQARSLVQRVRAVPGVVAATLSNDLPLDGSAGAVFYTAEGQPPVTAQNVPRAYIHTVSPDFFATLGIPLAQGRTFADNELTQQATAIVVSDQVVKRFWPGQDAIGKRLKLGAAGSNNPWLSIVGVVGDVKYRGLPANPTKDPDIYLPFLDRNAIVAIAVRTTSEPTAVAGAIRSAIRAADPSITVYSVRSMDELIGAQTAQSRFIMWLMGAFAAIALSLAVIGIYGVMSYLVAQRTREIGVRLALGAAGSDILRLVVGNGARLIAVGIVIGIAATFALERLVSTLLFGVTALDAAAAIAVAVLAAVALLACYVPALRATRVSPITALRYE
jgi:putative ABC transport system permease protein